MSPLSLPCFRATTSTRTNDQTAHVGHSTLDPIIAHVGHSTLDPSFALHSSTERSSSSTRSLGHLAASPPRCPRRTCESCGSRPPTLQGFWRALRAAAAIPPIQPPQVASSASMRSSRTARVPLMLLPLKLSATAVALHQKISPRTSWMRPQHTASSGVHAIPLSMSQLDTPDLEEVLEEGPHHHRPRPPRHRPQLKRILLEEVGGCSSRIHHTRQMTSRRYVAS